MTETEDIILDEKPRQPRRQFDLILAYVVAGLVILRIIFLLNLIPVMSFFWDLLSFLDSNFLVVVVLALYLIAGESKFMRSKWMRIIRAFFGLLILGVLFKILHWPGADFVLLGAITGLIVIYTIWFIRKPKKLMLDWVKWLWISAYIGLTGAEFFRLGLDQFFIAPDVLMAVMVLLYAQNSAYTHNQDKKKKTNPA